MAREVFSRWVLLVLMVSALVKGKSLFSINVVPQARENNRFQNYLFAPMTETVTYTDGRTVKLSDRYVQKLFDGNLRNRFQTRHIPGANVTREYIVNKFRYRVKVVSYRIRVPRFTSKASYPRSWIVWGVKVNRDDVNEKVMLDKVKSADFYFHRGGVYRGKIADPGAGYDKFALEITEDNSPEDAPKLDVLIAEVGYRGPKGQYNKRIKGGLNCKSQRVPQYPFYPSIAKGTHFSNDSQMDALDLHYLFDLDPAERYVSAHYPDADEDPLIVGTIWSDRQVLQFGIVALVPRTPPKRGWEDATFFENKVVLEGHKCDPSCDGLGDDGWEVLARGKGSKHYANKWLVKYPGDYMAYRVKIFRSPAEYGKPELKMLMREVFLMTCK